MFCDGLMSVGLNQAEETVAYRIMLRGPKDSVLNIGGGPRTSNYGQWASNQLMTEPFRARDADHLKPGEFVRVVGRRPCRSLR